ncbi:MAG: DUF1365 domain-containing protein [Alteromonadaceae bacterium]|nr:DUF1365 domain-containing protein [Alteromonadaceae bacterium]MBH85774.1 DUF1365 domain-containing protein [Alteromonadaceae bacterium]
MPIPSTFRSQWLNGRVRHRRMHPVKHEFTYNTGMLALNLDEWSRVHTRSRLFSLERFNWLSLARKDYFNPDHTDLKTAIIDQVVAATGWQPDGDIELITNPRYLGFSFNPVSFYCCYRAGEHAIEGAVPEVIVAQITNTPWFERHVYCLQGAAVYESSSGWKSQRYDFRKRFHVSPYNGMEQSYRWMFSFRGNQIRIHMNVYEEGIKQFDATLNVHRMPFTRQSVRDHVKAFPLESLKVAGGIYWQALRLKFKGANFQTHPDKLDRNSPAFRMGHQDNGERVDTRTPDTGKVSSWRT